MQYNDTIDDSRLYLRLALEKIGQHELPTDPVNYCIWYEYASGKNRELKALIDNYLEKNNTIPARISKQLFNQFILNGTETLASLIQKELKKVFANLFGTIKSTSHSLSESGSNLETINQALVPSMPEADVEKIVHQIKREIEKLESSSDSFKDEIQQANREIDQLKIKMEQYRNEALKDPLTQIDNRRSYDKKLKMAIDEANADGNPLCMIMADIDHFKKINDTHGHLVGDNFIRMVAATIKNTIKGKDLVARIGGEEFAILLPDTPYVGAMKLAEILRASFEKLDMKKKKTGELLGKITLSFGVTTYKQDEAAEDFFNRADSALYTSKETGRNKVTGI